MPPNQSKSPLFLIVLFCLLAVVGTQAQVQLGIDVLRAENFAPLRGKRVGLVTNHTGIDSRGIKTRQILHQARGVQLVALFAPEHGIDGKIAAGKYVASRTDPLTGLTIHSLYGPTRKPTPAMLRGIDLLVYDMQDIGSRSYTYISTMVKCMEAAGEAGIPFMVLDRPNPLGGLRIEGPPLEPKWTSFVGQIPVPYVHGMTAGELALMSNAKGWAAPRCKLSVVEMRGWRRGMTWQQTKLPWVATSPNIPYPYSPYYYVATGLIGAVGGFDNGCGGPRPFEIAASKHLNPARFTAYLRSLNMPGVTFTEYNKAPFKGARLHIEPNAPADLTALGVYILAAAQKAAPRTLFTQPDSKYEIFYKCYGSNSIRRDLENGVPPQRIVAGWAAGNARFAQARRPYLLY